MRILGLVFCLCLLTSFAFAQVTAEIIKTDIDNNGNIRVWTCHKINGVEVTSQYPKIDGKSVYCTRYSKQNFKDLADKTAINNYILNDIKNYSNTLIQKEFDKNAPETLNQIKIDYNATANQNFATTNLDTLVGKKLIVTEVSQQLDTNNDGVNDATITFKDDGTKTITPIP